MSILKVTQWDGAEMVSPAGLFNDGQPLRIICPDGDPHGMNKLAGAGEYTKVTRGFVEDQLPRIMKPGHAYVVDTAMGAGEGWSSNVNADWFAESVLKREVHTFVTRAHPFFHHKNQDPRFAKGNILFSAYFDKMRRVELVVEISRDKGAEVTRRIEAGEFPRTSMGWRAVYDVCSICGNKAKNRAQYCQHLRFEPNRIYDDGRKVYAINPEGYFFDHSYVLVPADRTAGTMFVVKVASDQALFGENVSGAKLAEALDVKIHEETSVSKLKNPEAARALLKAAQALSKKSASKSLPVDEIQKLSEMGMQKAASTLAQSGHVPTPLDVARICCASAGDDCANSYLFPGEDCAWGSGSEANVKLARVSERSACRTSIRDLLDLSINPRLDRGPSGPGSPKLAAAIGAVWRGMRRSFASEFDHLCPAGTPLLTRAMAKVGWKREIDLDDLAWADRQLDEAPEFARMVELAADRAKGPEVKLAWSGSSDELADALLDAPDGVDTVQALVIESALRC